MAAYRMTPARRKALKKAQTASARKRRGKGKGKLATANRRNSSLKRAMKYTAIGVGVVGAAAGAGYLAHRNYRNAQKTFKAPRTDYSKGFKSDFSNAYKRKPRNKKANLAPKRVFVSDTGYKKKRLDYRQEARLRQHAKAGERSLYNAGLGVSKGTRVFVTGRRRNKKKQVTY